MNYQQTIDYLFNATPVFEHIGASAYKPGLLTMEALDSHYGHPHHSYKTIHVAGTNGKGSTSHALASVLQEYGYKVGLYTSPHLRDFRERIRVNGKMMDEQSVIDFVEDYIRWNATREAPLSPSFFELTTAMAFDYFRKQQVDIAVIEVGLGGRLDCTNIITPILSVITNISFDHTQFLGNTLADIAKEKAGIIKEHVPVVIGETTPETRPVFQDVASKLHAPLFWAEKEPSALGEDIDFELKGDYQRKNKRTIFCALKRLAEQDIISLPADLKCKEVTDGMANISKNTGLEGRWQVIRRNPLVVCDTGHNVAGWEYLSQQIRRQPCRQLHIVFGMVDDKDVDSVLAMLPEDAHYYYTQAQTKRAIPVETIMEKAKAHNLHGEAYKQVKDAYQAAISAAAPSDFIFVGGSSYIVANFLTTSCL